MTDLINPYDEVLTRDPTLLTPPEQKEYESLVKPSLSTTEQVAVALGAAWLLHQAIIRRRLKEELAKQRQPTRDTLKLVLGALYKLYVPTWLGIATPALIAGYRLGMKEAQSGQIPAEYLVDIAENYAKDLGRHLNEVSGQALLEGFQAQINRKVPPARAAQMVANAYGVPPKGMNTLVSVWNSEDPKKLTNVVIEPFKDTRARVLIEHALNERAKQVGDNETWAARKQAKQLVWMYGMQTGVIPKNAKRTWVTARDEKVCKFCGPLHMKTVPVGEKFPGGIWTPPHHINCRCDIILDFAPNEDLDEELRQLSYQEVGKAYATDPFDRDKKGRFAHTESRKHKPYATPTAIDLQRLYDEAQQRSLQEQMEQAMRSNKMPTHKMASNKMASNKMVSNKIAPSKMDAGQKLERPKLERQKMEKIQLSERAKQKIALVLNAMAADPTPAEEMGPEWEVAEFPIAVIVPEYEMGSKGDVLLTDKDQGISLGDRIWGGIDNLHERIQDYWNDQIMDYLESAQEDGDAYYAYTDDEGDWLVDRDGMLQALEEAVHGIKKPNSTHVVLENSENRDYTKLVPASTLVTELELGDWVESNKPNVVVLRHVNFDKHELVGQYWKVPGRYRVLTESNDIPHIHGSDFPMVAYYVEPTD